MTARRRVAALLLPALALGLAGCRPRTAPASPSTTYNLEFTRQMWNVDVKHGVVRVDGEVVNRGPAPVPAIEVRAVLVGSSGEARGENTTEVLHDLAPGEARTFSVLVGNHGGVSRVDLKWQVPEKTKR